MALAEPAMAAVSSHSKTLSAVLWYTIPFEVGHSKLKCRLRTVSVVVMTISSSGGVACPLAQVLDDFVDDSRREKVEPGRRRLEALELQGVSKSTSSSAWWNLRLAFHARGLRAPHCLQWSLRPMLGKT